MGILATSQITIIDLNDQISLSSYISSNSPKIQFMTTGGSYTPNYETSPIILNAELYKIGVSGNNVISSAEVKKVTWHVKMAQETNWTEITAATAGSNYEIITHDGKTSSIKIKKNVMNKTNTAIAVQCQIHYQESWMPDPHIQKSEIEFSLSVQGNTGANGTDSYTTILSNETHSIICSSNGTPESGELGSSGRAISDIIAYKGSTKLTPVADTATPGNNQFRYKIVTQTGCTVSRTDNDTFYINTVTADKGTIEVEINCENKQTIKKVMTFTKVKAGANGSNGASAKVVTITGEQTFKYAAGASTPTNASMILTRTLQGVSGGKWQYYNATASTPAWADFNPAQTGANITITHNMANTLFATASNMQMRVRYIASDNATFDEITIVKLKDGANGTNGTNAYTVVLSNESHSVIAENNGTVAQAEIDKAFSLIQAFKGTANATFTASIVTAETTGCTAEITSGNRIQLKTITEDTAKITVDVRVDNAQTVRKVMTVTKARKGANGSAGASALAIDITGGQVFTYDAAGALSPANITLTATCKNFTGTTSNIKWEVIDGNTVVHTLAAAGGTTSPAITPSTPGWNKDVLKVRATYTGNTKIYDEHSLTIVRDGKNPIMAYIWTPNGNTIKNDDKASLDLEAVLFWGSIDKTQDANAQYRWVKVAPNGTETPLWPTTAGNTVAGNANGWKTSVHADDIPNVLTVKCYITYNGQIARDTIVLEDKSDPFQSSIFSTAGDVFKNGQGTTYLVARVFRDGIEYDVIDIYDTIPSATGVAAGTKIYVKSNDKYHKLVGSAWTAIETPSKENGESKFSYTWNRWNENGMVDSNTFKNGKIAKVTSSNVNQKANFVVTIED